MSGFRATILKMVRNAGVFAWSSAGLVAGGISGHLAMDTQSFLERAQKIEGTVVEVKKTQKVESASEQLTKMTSEQKGATKPADTKQQSDAKQAPPVVTQTPPAMAATETGVGQTAGKPPKPAEPSYVMVVRYVPAQGSPLTIETSATAKIREGDKIPLLYDPKNPKDARLTATSDLWTGPIALGIAALVTLSIGLLVFVRNRRTAAMPVPDVWLDETKFEFLPFVPGRLETYIGDDKAPLGPPVGITATALAIRDGEAGKYPLVLCEMLAYLSALAYENEATLEPYLKERYSNAFTNLGFFDRKHTQGFGFLFEETVYIVMRGTESGKEGRSDWKQNLRLGEATAEQFLPKDATWTTPARHYGFAEAWDFVRDDIESWIANAKLDKPDRQYIFSGHSLGGALAFNGAFEFAKRGRDVAAVITFGAPMAGRAKFVEAYDAVGLGKRTLRLQFDQDMVPVLLGIIGYKHVGREWLPAKPPLQYRRVIIWAAIGSAFAGLIQFGLRKKNATLMDQLRRPFWNKLTLFLAYAGPFALMALAAHKMQSRYALALSVMSYQRIRQLTAPDGTEAQYASSYQRLSEHLKRIRGTTAENPGKLFDQMHRLPNKIASRTDLEWYRQWYPNRTF